MSKHFFDNLLNCMAFIGAAITGITKSDISFYMTLMVAVTAAGFNIMRMLDWLENRKQKKT